MVEDFFWADLGWSCLVWVLLLFPQTGLPVWGSYSFQRVASVGRMILPLSPGLHPTLGALGRMSLHLSSTCLPLVSHTCLSLWVPWVTLVSHSGFFGLHEFTLASPMPFSTSGSMGGFHQNTKKPSRFKNRVLGVYNQPFGWGYSGMQLFD